MSTDIIKCNVCNKKLKISAIKCKCNLYFCYLHRDEKIHKCTFNYLKNNQNLLEKNNPIVERKKIDIN